MCAFLWAPFILCYVFLLGLFHLKAHGFHSVSILWFLAPFLFPRLEYNSNVRLCILEVCFGLWIFKNSVLFACVLCNIIYFLIEMIAFSLHAFYLFFFTILLFGSVKLLLLLVECPQDRKAPVLRTHSAIGISSWVLCSCFQLAVCSLSDWLCPYLAFLCFLV